MKVTKTGKVSLEKGEKRLGNFFFKNEPDYIKMQDLSRSVTVRLRKETSASAYLIENAIENNLDKELEIYGMMYYYFCSALKDSKCFEEILESLQSCAIRNQEALGIKENISKEEDDEVIESLKEVSELERQIRESYVAETAAEEHKEEK